MSNTAGELAAEGRYEAAIQRIIRENRSPRSAVSDLAHTLLWLERFQPYRTKQFLEYLSRY